MNFSVHRLDGFPPARTGACWTGRPQPERPQRGPPCRPRAQPVSTRSPPCAPTATPTCDVFVWGTVFLDIIMTGLEQLPDGGQEVWADGMGSCPGGIANLAVAARRLGLRTSLAAAFGDDAYGDFCWETLADEEDVDLSRSPPLRAAGTPPSPSRWPCARDRGMVSHGHAPPIDATDADRRPTTLAGRDRRARPPTGRSSATTRPPGSRRPRTRRLPSSSPTSAGTPPGAGRRGPGPARRLRRLPPQRRRGDGLHPHPHRQRGALRPRRPRPARRRHQRRGGRAGHRLAHRRGGRRARPAGRRPRPHGRRRRLRRRRRPRHRRRAGRSRSGSRFASLCSALAVQHFGGSLAAPGWGDIADWWHQLRDGERHRRATTVRCAAATPSSTTSSPTSPSAPGRRAAATIARHVDVEG